MRSETSQPTRHYCDYPECGKSFRRAEHLTRHKLNHTDSTIPCPQCDHLFYRRDLLQRHLTLKHGTPAKPRARSKRSARPEPTTPSPATAAAMTTGPAVNGLHVEVDISASHGVVPAFDNIFQLPPSPLDLAQDWSWAQQPNPVLPVHHNPIAQADQTGGDIPAFDLEERWMSPVIPQDFYVSQAVYDFLLSLGPVTESSYHFTAENVSAILNAAYRFITDSVPMFHRPTFSFDHIQGELCTSVFCVGLLTSPELALHRLGCVLLGQTRSGLLQYVHENAIHLSDLGILQAMFLVEFSGMYLADRTAMELSDIFHGTLVTSARRLGLFDTSFNNARAASTSPDENEWQNAVEYETAKRLAYFIFALDVEQALLFGHERSIISVYSMKLELPTGDEEWHIPSQRISTTRQNRSAVCRTKFHLLNQTMLSQSQGHPGPSILSNPTQLSSHLLLLGLSSVALDLLRRQQDPFFDTKKALSCLRSVLPAMHAQLITAGPDASMLKLHGRAVYHVTVIALCTPLDDLERAANDGFSRTGRTPRHRARAALIRLLARKVGPEPARHAVQLLKLFLVPCDWMATSPSQTPPVTGYVNAATPAHSLLAAGFSPYEPSALYFGVLTLWAYIIGRVTDDDDVEAQLEDHPYIPEDGMQGSQASGSSPSSQGPSVAAILQDMEVAIDSNDSSSLRRRWRIIMRNVTDRLALRRNNNAQEYSQVLGSLSDNLSF